MKLFRTISPFCFLLTICVYAQLENGKEACAKIQTGQVIKKQPGSNIRTQKIVPFVVGGKYTSIASYPWMAALFSKSDKKRQRLQCGGSLIDEDTILTAAHCFPEDNRDEKYVVILGDQNLSDDSDGFIPAERDVVKIVVHPEFNYPVLYNDIAILKLNPPLNFTETIRPICLPNLQMAKDTLEGVYATALGWGLTESQGRYSKGLQEVDLPIWSSEKCSEEYKDFKINFPNEIIAGQICAGYKDQIKGTCQGDDGGPLVIKNSAGTHWILAGIISAGDACTTLRPGIFTRVTEYLSWIAKNSNSA